MTSDDDRTYDGLDKLVDPEDLDDLEDDELVVPRRQHAAGSLQSGSRFGRHAAPAQQPAAAQRPAAQQPAAQNPAPAQRTVAAPAQRPAAATQTPAAPIPPQTRRAQQAYVDPDANRAAFDAKYSQDAYGDAYGQQPAAGGGLLHRRSKANKGGREQAPATYQAYQAQSADAPQGRQRRQRRHKAHPVLRVLITLVAVLAIVYAVVCIPIDRSIAFDAAEEQGVQEATTPQAPFMPYYVLLMGSDARDGDTSSRTDTMMLARIDVVRNQITLVSIPRDTMVEIEGYGTQKINAAYTFGGAGGAVAAVSKLTGETISEAAVIRFDGVETLVDAIGGITVDVPVDVNDPDYTHLVLPAGPTEMDGHTALLFSPGDHRQDPHTASHGAAEGRGFDGGLLRYLDALLRHRADPRAHAGRRPDGVPCECALYHGICRRCELRRGRPGRAGADDGRGGRGRGPEHRHQRPAVVCGGLPRGLSRFGFRPTVSRMMSDPWGRLNQCERGAA